MRLALLAASGLVLCLVFFWLAQADAQPESTAERADQGRSGGRIIIPFPEGSSTLHPLLGNNALEATVTGLVFEGLLRGGIGPEEPEPGLATAWEERDNGRIYRFTLRSGVLWHDGEPLTVQDVTYTFNLLLDPLFEAESLRARLGDLVSVVALDASRVEFRFSRPGANRLSILGSIPILPYRRIAGTSARYSAEGVPLVGTGPYFVSRADTGGRIVLQRNPDYWGKEAYLNQIILQPMSSQQAYEDFLRGEVGLFFANPDECCWNERDRRSMRRYRVLSEPVRTDVFVAWNFRHSMFRDRRVRQALAYAVDVRRLGLTLFPAQAAGDQVEIGGPYTPSGPKPYEYEPDRARELLRAAGWIDQDGDGLREREGEEARLTLLLPGDWSLGGLLGRHLRESFARVGVAVTLRSMTLAQVREALAKREFDAALLQWDLSRRDTLPLHVWHSSQAVVGDNFVGFIDREADQVVERAAHDSDPTVRRDAMLRLRAILHREQPYLWLVRLNYYIYLHRKFGLAGGDGSSLDLTRVYLRDRALQADN